MKLQELRKIAKEVKEELGFEEIDPKGKQADLENQLTEVALSIGAEGEDAIEESELDDLSKETKSFLLELRDANQPEEKEETPEEEPEPEEKSKKKEKKTKKAKKEKAPEPEQDEEPDFDILERVQSTDLDGLKALIKEQGKEVFPIASRGLPLQKNADKLRTKALKDLGEDVLEKQEKEEKPVEKAKVKKDPKANGTYLTRLWTVENPKITPDKIFDKLEKKGVTMALISVKLRQNEVLAVLKIQEELKK